MERTKTVAAVVMLRNDWPGEFRRTVNRGKKNEIALVFSPGKAIELAAAELEAVKADIGVALIEVTLDDKGRPRVPLAAEAAAANPRLEELEAVIAEQAAAIYLLVSQVKELGGDPVVDVEGSGSDSQEPTGDRDDAEPTGDDGA